ncbi:MAG: FMN-binding protein [Myxococcales bacterium]|nr:FMN-binding protein [Myxococcales bacterium]
MARRNILERLGLRRGLPRALVPPLGLALGLTLGLGALGPGALLPGRAKAETFFSVRGLLGSHFRDSTSVGFERLRPIGTQRARIEAQLGRRLAREEYIVYIARSRGAIDGYAIFDSELGQHEPIDFATFLDAGGRVSRVEVLAYREPYGDGIRAERFRRQFLGRHADTGFRTGRDIDAISGATLSSRSMARAVHRAVVLVSEMRRAPAGQP